MYRIITFCLFVCLLTTACVVFQTDSHDVLPTPDPKMLLTPTTPEVPATSETPVTSEAPVASETPVTSEAPVASETPVTSEAPVTPETPVTLPPVVLPDHTLPGPIILSKAAEETEVYLVDRWSVSWPRRHIVDWETFLHLGFEQNDIDTNERFAVGYPEGAPITRLLKGAGEPVYLMENGLRRHIPDMETFLQLGYRQEDISEVPDELLSLWPLGEPLPSVLGTPAEPVPSLSQERRVSTFALRDRVGVGYRNHEIYTIYTDGTRPKRLIHALTGSTCFYDLAWSPDGQHIAFASTPDSSTTTSSIAVTNSDSWNPTQLTGNQSFNPVWSLDGSHIAFWSSAGEAFGIYVMDADGENSSRLADGRHLAWTVDGRIAFCAMVGNDYNAPMTLTVMDPDGQNQQPVDQAITVWDQHYSPWRQEVWAVDGGLCGAMDTNN